MMLASCLSTLLPSLWLFLLIFAWYFLCHSVCGSAGCQALHVHGRRVPSYGGYAVQGSDGKREANMGGRVRVKSREEKTGSEG